MGPGDPGPCTTTRAFHAFFSLDLIGVYTHNPLMHGPFQFFGLNALFNVFGESEVSARALAAVSGTALVGLPIFLRGYLGRWGSMAASFFLVFSPTLLYFSRFVRNDIYMALWTLGLVVCMWRYLDQGKARYLYIGAALLSLSFATKENSYITLLILASFLLILWLRRPFQEEGVNVEGGLSIRFRSTGLYRAYAKLTGGLARISPYLIPSTLVFTLVVGWTLSAILWSLDIYQIFGRVNLRFSLISLGAVLGVYIAILPLLYHLRGHRDSLATRLGRWWRRAPLPDSARYFFRDGSIGRLSRPGVYWLLLVLFALPLAAAAFSFVQGPLGLTLVNPNSLDGANSDHKPGFPDGTPVGNISLAIVIGAVIYLLVVSVAIGLKWNWRKFLVSGVIFWGIFVLFYTTLFTNPGQGLGSGLWASLGYWIAQQDVRRGGQPWYYYLVLSGTYEFLPLLLILGAGVWYLAIRRKIQRLGFWLTQGLLVAVALVLLLSPFWMPTSTGYQLLVGTLLLVGAGSILLWYVAFLNPSFLRSRVLVADVALLVLLVLIWQLPRILGVWDFVVVEKIFDARSPLTAILLGISLVVITFKSVEREDRFTWFLIYWLGMTLVLYSFAAEKMPWLMVHTALPLAILGGRVVGQLLEGRSWWPRLSPQWGLGLVGVAVVGLLVFHTGKVSVEAAYGIDREGSGDVPIEMLVYTQTSPDITETLARIDDLARTTGKGADLSIIVDRTSGFGYPWRWYLRDYHNVQWPCYDDNPNDATCKPVDQPLDADVLIIHHANRSSAESFLSNFDGGQQIRHRAWFPEFDTYRRGAGPLPVDSFFESLVSADSWKQWWDYFLFRDLEEDKRLGSEDSVVFFRLQDDPLSESTLK